MKRAYFCHFRDSFLLTFSQILRLAHAFGEWRRLRRKKTQKWVLQQAIRCHDDSRLRHLPALKTWFYPNTKFLVCRFDYLIIKNENNQEFGEYCGYQFPGSSVIVTGRFVKLFFHSDGFVNKKGYNLSFTAVPLGKYSKHDMMASMPNISSMYTVAQYILPFQPLWYRRIVPRVNRMWNKTQNKRNICPGFSVHSQRRRNLVTFEIKMRP